MATGDFDGDDGCRHHSKRCRVSVDEDDGDKLQVAAGGEMDDDDDLTEYGLEDDGDDPDEYAVVEETEVDDSAAVFAAANQTYNVLTEDAILARQDKDTADVAEVLSIPSSFAAVLLRHFKWRTSRVQDEWFSDDRRVRDAVGLPADGVVPVPMALSRRPLVCSICFEAFDAGETRSAGCSHYYCDACWREYVHAAVGDGPRCLSLRCPDPSCSAAVVRELVDEVSADKDRDRYARFALRSYVEESGGVVRWCPAAGCTRALEFTGDDGGGADVLCDCGRNFCWNCGEEAHRPVSCGTVRAWLAKNRSDSETANWVLANTKHCPKCRRPIEKNQGCNHMTCGAPCGHEFCWLCFDPWEHHSHCSHYDYRPQQQDGDAEGNNNGDADVDGKMERRRRRKQAKASLDRYLYYYERWASNGKSWEKAVADMDELRSSGLEKMAAWLEIQVEDLEFLTAAYELIAEGRRVMRWVHAYGYFLDPREHDKVKRDLFDQQQDDANRRLEELHHSAEVERIKVCSGPGGSAMNELYRDYKDRVVYLTKVARNYFGNLVRAFETNLSSDPIPEVISVKNKVAS